MYNSDDFGEFDMIVYEDNTFRLFQAMNGETYYKAKCSHCGEWFDINFSDIVNSINNIFVGEKGKKIISTYPYPVTAVIVDCPACEFTHVFDGRKYVEINTFRKEDATQECIYNSKNGTYQRITYKIFDSELIAKYVLGAVYVSIFHYADMDYYKIIQNLIQSGKIMEPCLVSTIMIDIIDNDKYDDTLLEEWYLEGYDKLSNLEIDMWDEIVQLML